MNFLRANPGSRTSLILLVLMALVFAPIVSAGISETTTAEVVSSAKTEHSKACAEMHDADAAATEQASAVDCCDQNTDCKTHCQNLVLTHLPVSALLITFTSPIHSSEFISLSSAQMLTGIAASLDPRPPCV